MASCATCGKWQAAAWSASIVLQLRVDRSADLLVAADRAERPEAAAGLDRRHVDRIPGGSDRDQLPGADRIDDGDRPHQAVRVRMQRTAEQHLAGPRLHDAPPVHDRDPRAEEPHHREVVGDEEERKVVLPLELAQEIEHLRLDRDVERGDGLVEDDEARRRLRARGRSRRAGTVRRTSRTDGVAGTRSRARRARASRRHGRAGSPRAPDAVRYERRGDDPADGVTPVERAGRVLEDGGQRAADRPQLVARKLCERAAVELDRAAVGFRQAEDGVRDRGLAGAGFAHEAERLPAADGERDAVDGADDAGVAACLEMLVQLGDVEKRRRGHRGRPSGQLVERLELSLLPLGPRSGTPPSARR